MYENSLHLNKVGKECSVLHLNASRVHCAPRGCPQLTLLSAVGCCCSLDLTQDYGSFQGTLKPARAAGSVLPSLGEMQGYSRA